MLSGAKVVVDSFWFSAALRVEQGRSVVGITFSRQALGTIEVRKNLQDRRNEMERKSRVGQ